MSDKSRGLRPYQQMIIDKTLEAYQSGCRRIVISAATGIGKTYTLSKLIPLVPEASTGSRQTLVLAHRRELISQLASSIRESNPDLKVEVEMADRKASPSADVIVASVATIGMKDPKHPQGYSKRLCKFDPCSLKMLAIDEVHHATADTYKRVIAYFGADHPQCDLLLWGCSATVKRSDGVPLKGIFDEVGATYNLLQAIEDKWLSPLTGVRVVSATTLDNVKTYMGDFAEGALARTVDTPYRNQIVVKAYRTHCDEGRRKSVLVYAVDREHAKHICETFEGNGLKASYVDGETTDAERDDTLARFKARKVPILVSVGCLVEGTDLPCTDAIIMARPTRSSGLYIQIIGRATRLYPEKTDGLIIDVVDAYQGKDLCSVPSLLGANPRLDMAGKSIMEVQKILSEAVSRNPKAADAETLGEVKQIASEPIDLFAASELPEELKRMVSMSWMAMNDEYRLSIPLMQQKADVDPSKPKQDSDAVSHIALRQDVVGQWSVLQVDRKGGEFLIRKRDEIKDAFAVAEKFVRATMPDVTRFVSRTASWRGTEPSEAQLGLLRKLNIKAPNGLTKGMASELIDQRLAEIRTNGGKTKWQARAEVRKGKKLQTKLDDVKVGRI